MALIVMQDPETGKKADVPESEVQRWTDWGWRVALPEKESIAYVVAKGPRGKFYVKYDGKIVSDPFETEDEASVALAALAAPKE